MSIQEREIPPEPTAAARTDDPGLPGLDGLDGLDGAYRDHHGAVTAAASRVCGPDHAVDVAQDVFVTLWRHPDKFDPDRGSLRSFLTAMARHKAVDALRSESARRARELRVEAGERRLPSGLDEGLLRVELGGQVREAVAGLPVGEREAIIATFYGDRSYRGTAAWLGQPEGTVKSRIRSGLRRLHPILADLELARAALPQPFAAGDAVCMEAPERWFAPPSPAEQDVLALAAGPVLDIGCGPGRHVLALAADGVEALGIDVSSQLVGMARRRGAAVLEGSIFDAVPNTGNWETCLLLDGNIGIGASPETLLARTCTLIRPGGSVLVEAAAPGASPNARCLQLRVGGALGPRFSWADIAIDRVHDLAEDAGLNVQRIWAAEGRWFAWLRT